MKPELRDYFAVHFAAALAAEQRHGFAFIAGRAYDLADAMLEERARRIEAEMAAFTAEERASTSIHGALLDEVEPPSERDWADDGPLFARPGLARTEPAIDPRHRSTGS
jgi:hypothetical protein